MSGPAFDARCLVSSAHPVEAPALVLEEPLSFWGGVDGDGRVIDRHHPQHGASVTGRVLVMPSGRGSSSSSSVLAQVIRDRVGPVAIVLREPDAIVALGALVARELYEDSPPVVVLGPAEYDSIRDGEPLEVVADGDSAIVRRTETESG